MRRRYTISVQSALSAGSGQGSATGFGPPSGTLEDGIGCVEPEMPGRHSTKMCSVVSCPSGSIVFSVWPGLTKRLSRTLDVPLETLSRWSRDRRLQGILVFGPHMARPVVQVERLLARNPDDRFASMDEMIAALEATVSQGTAPTEKVRASTEAGPAVGSVIEEAAAPGL